MSLHGMAERMAFAPYAFHVGIPNKYVLDDDDELDIRHSHVPVPATSADTGSGMQR